MKETKGNQGRIPFTRIERARSEAVKALIRLREVESEYNAVLGLLPEDKTTDYGRSVMQVADERMEMTEELERINSEINNYTQMLRKDVELNGEQEEEYQELRNQRSEILEVLDVTPDLGSSYSDWAEAAPELKKRDIGRPKQSIEVMVIRARSAYESSTAKLNKLEKEKNLEPTNVSALAAEEMSKPRRPGRPKKDPISILREKLVSTEEKVLEIETGIADKDYQEKLAKAPRNASGNIVGRPPSDPQLKLSDFANEVETTERQIEFMLRDYDDQMANKVRLTTLKSRITMLNKLIDNHGSDCTESGFRHAKDRLNELQSNEIELVNAMSSQVLSSVDASDATTEQELKEKGERLSKMLNDARNEKSSQKREELINESEELLNEFGIKKAVNQ